MSQMRSRNRSLLQDKRDPNNVNASLMTTAEDAKMINRNCRQNKNKFPKAVRYDLENALLGLCDIWFEEIKPHLMRNNIKLHVHEPTAPPAEVSHKYMELSPGAKICSHIDPGAADPALHRNVSFAAYCSKQPTASSAPCRRPAPQEPLQPPPVPVSDIRSPLHSKTYESKEISLKPVLTESSYCHLPEKINIEANRRSKRKNKKRNNKQPCSNSEDKYFSKDLINIIADYDRRLKKVRRRSDYETSCTARGLFAKTAKRTQKRMARQSKVYPPWK